MFVHDMKNACMEKLIELYRADNDKKENLKVNEAVKLLSMGDYIIVSTYDNAKIQRFKPVNEHTKSVVEHIMDNQELCLCEVVNDKNNTIIIMVKQYPVRRNEMNVAVLVKDEFIKTKLAMQKQFRNIREPYDEMKKDAVYSPDDKSEYFIVGKHVRKSDDDNEEFVIAAGSYYLSIRKRFEDGKDYYEAEKFSRNIKAENYCFALVRGSLKFSDEKSEIKDKVRAILPDRGELYIDVWNQYGQIETEVILDRIRDAGAVHYKSYELSGSVVHFYLNEFKAEKQLTKFASYVKKGDMIGILPFNPFQDAADAVDLRNVFESKEVSAKTVDGKVAEEINTQSGRISIAINNENFAEMEQFKDGGYIFISFKGDKRRLERRESARRSIETMTCPMPELSAIMEGRRATKPKKTNIEALSPTLLEDPAFSNLTPNQIEAISIALNTPDMAIIQGPPGTGKTTVIAAITKRLEEEADTAGGMFGRTLITAFQHDAVQNATDRLRILGLPAIKFGKKYSDIEDDSLDVNLTVQRWINEKLTDLDVKHADAKDIEYMAGFNRLYVNYLKSAVSLDQTIEILEKIRDEVRMNISVELNERLSSVIKGLKFQVGEENGASDTLIKAIRSIPTNEIAMVDNGRVVLKIAISRLKEKQDEFLAKYIDVLENIQETKDYDYAKLTVIKRDILAHIIPLERIFNEKGKRDEVDMLLCDISDYLRKQIMESKKGEALILLEYMQALEDNPMAVKKAILDYSVVNGATNQQVMSKEISELKNNDIVYDNVLMDEAARSNPLDLFIPMSVAKEKIILVGDHRQLPHIIDEEVVRKMEENDSAEEFKEEIEDKLKKSMFQQLFYKLQELEEREPKITRVITLDTQFRMHPSIGKFVNKNFYQVHGENVNNGIKDVKHFEHGLPGLENKACIWYDVPLKYGKERAGKSKSRAIEARRIAEHLKEVITGSGGKDLSYGIITFYRDQVDEINNALASKEIGILLKDENGHYSIAPEYWNNRFGDEEYIKVGTVDAFQGREFDVVYLSMVRSNTERVRQKPMDMSNRREILERDKELRRKYGFLMFENRLCVAMSRGKKLLICVGDSGMLQDDSAKDAIPSLIDFYNMCKGGDEYGGIIE